MKTKNKYLQGIRYLLILGAVGGSLVKIPSAQNVIFLLSVMPVIVNSQLRTIFFKTKRSLILSLLLETGAIVCLSRSFNSLVYFLLFLTVTDTVLKLGDEVFPMIFVESFAFIYCISKIRPWETTFILCIFYLLFLLLLLALRKELHARTNVESLYDLIRKNNDELEAARLRLLDYSKQVETLTKLEERNRISRELHDSIGHSLTGILMQVDAAIQILDVNREKGMEILRSAYENINGSIETVRRTVKSLRPVEYQPAISSISRLVEKFRSDTRVNIKFEALGVPYTLYPSVDTVLYRNTQEALTNAIRHGNARNITVTIKYGIDLVTLEIRDDGPGCVELKKGFGLSGMEERINIIGGAISFYGEDGFTVRMSVPRKDI